MTRIHPAGAGILTLLGLGFAAELAVIKYGLTIDSARIVVLTCFLLVGVIGKFPGLTRWIMKGVPEECFPDYPDSSSFSSE